VKKIECVLGKAIMRKKKDNNKKKEQEQDDNKYIIHNFTYENIIM